MPVEVYLTRTLSLPDVLTAVQEELFCCAWAPYLAGISSKYQVTFSNFLNPVVVDLCVKSNLFHSKQLKLESIDSIALGLAKTVTMAEAVSLQNVLESV